MDCRGPIDVKASQEQGYPRHPRLSTHSQANGAMAFVRPKGVAPIRAALVAPRGYDDL